MSEFSELEAMGRQAGQPRGPGKHPGAAEPDAGAADNRAASAERDVKLLYPDDGIGPLGKTRDDQMMLESRNRGIAESRNRGIAESRNRGIAESRNRGIAESRNRGIAESRNRGIAESRNRGIAESRFRREENSPFG